MSSTALKLPGFGLPLDTLSDQNYRGRSLFSHAITNPVVIEGLTLREKRMLDFINQITDKPRWTEKIHHDEIVAKWRVEACGTPKQQSTSPNHLSQQCFDYCLQELRDKAVYLQKNGVIHVLDVHASIVKADLETGNDFCATLNSAVQALEDVPDKYKDWHPGSDGVVLDLVHPSLFPLEYGKTRVLTAGIGQLYHCLEQSGGGDICPVPKELQNGSKSSRKARNMPSGYYRRRTEPKAWGSYQWLPSDIHFNQEGHARIKSYVNNLHPQKHPELYRILEQAVDMAVPLWNECLSWPHDRTRIHVKFCDSSDFVRPTREDLGQSGDEDEGDISAMDTDKKYHVHVEESVQTWLRRHPKSRRLRQPNPTKPFVPFEEDTGVRRRDLLSEFPAGLQVIFKLANILLTPENPHYNGSSWHVEGALNEHICATALVYYDQDNIEDSYLEFRSSVNAWEMTKKAGQDEYEAVEDLYGIKNDRAAVQEIGQVLTRRRRLLAFPNVMQHRVRPFNLADPSKPGHRKILAMFLVDPHIRILSTSNVPPQQQDWWAEEVRKEDRFADLPVELFDRVMSEVDFPIKLDDACETREQLMAERGRFTKDYDQSLREDLFSFCEH